MPALNGSTEIILPIAGEEFPVAIPDEKRSQVKRQFVRKARAVRKQAARAANRATLAYTLGGSVGGTLATGGILALVAASGPIGLAGIAVTALGVMLTSTGIIVAHRLSNLRAEYDEEATVYMDIAEELR